MKRSLMLLALAVFITHPGSSAARPVEITTSAPAAEISRGDLDVAVRLIGGTGAVLRPGREINLTFRTSSDAYVIIYNIDAEGYVHLLYPADGNPRPTAGETVNFLPEAETGVTWKIAGPTGIEYIQALAVDDAERIDLTELRYLAQSRNLPEEQRLRIDMDPFLAFNMINGELIRDAERIPPATDYTYFYINRRVEHPAYLCHRCHSPGKIDDPYGTPCSEVVIEKIEEHEGARYPYPRLFAVTHIDAIDEPADDAFIYSADNLSVGYDDYRYDDTKVYLSIYHYGGWYPYNYNVWWPGYWAWYINWTPSWYWDSYWGYGWGVGWNWGGYYYHHWPFYSWYPYSYYAYWNSYRRGYWDGYYHDWYGWDHKHAYRPGRTLYAGRSFGNRALNYASTSAALRSERTLASSRLTRERTRTAVTTRSLERSALANRTARDRARAGLTAVDTRRGETSRLREYGSERVHGAYGTTRIERGAREIPRAGRTARREGDPIVDRGERYLYRDRRVIDRGDEQRRIRETQPAPPRPLRQRDRVPPQRDDSRSGQQGGTDRARERNPAVDRAPAPPPPRAPERAPERPSSPPPVRERDRGGSSARSSRDSGTAASSGSSVRALPSRSSSPSVPSRSSGTAGTRAASGGGSASSSGRTRTR